MNEIANNKVNLCDSCSQVYPDCTSKPENVYFGDGIGHDNICACSEYRPKTCGDGDTISRAAAIAFVDCGYLRPPTELAWSDKDVVDMLKRLPSAQPRHYHEENLLTYAHDMGVTLEQAKKELQKVTEQPETHDKRTDTHACDLISRQAAINAPVRMVSEGIEWIPVYHVEQLPSAQPEQRWIPTSEKLPEYDKPVLLSTAWGKTEIGFWTQRGWMIVACSYREFEQDAVTAWMPLPEPYKGEEE